MNADETTEDRDDAGQPLGTVPAGHPGHPASAPTSAAPEEALGGRVWRDGSGGNVRVIEVTGDADDGFAPRALRFFGTGKMRAGSASSLILTVRHGHEEEDRLQLLLDVATSALPVPDRKRPYSLRPLAATLLQGQQRSGTEAWAVVSPRLVADAERTEADDEAVEAWVEDLNSESTFEVARDYHFLKAGHKEIASAIIRRGTEAAAGNEACTAFMKRLEWLDIMHGSTSTAEEMAAEEGVTPAFAHQLRALLDAFTALDPSAAYLPEEDTTAATETA